MVLRWTQVGDERVVTCQNCGFIADRLRPKPESLAQLRARFARERRLARDRRRNYVIDTGPSERRTAARRMRRRRA